MNEERRMREPCSTRNDAVPLAATRTGLEIIVLSDASQRRTDTESYHLLVESKEYNGIYCATQGI